MKNPSSALARGLDDARTLALAMPQRWGVPPGPRLLGAPAEISALLLEAQPSEVWSHASDAHILCHVIQGQARHRQWHDGKLVYDGILPDRSIGIVTAGIAPRALIAEPGRAMHVYLPHVYLARRALAAGWRGRTDALEVIDPRFRPDPALQGLCDLLAASLSGTGKLDLLYVDSLADAIATRVLQRWSNLPQKLLEAPNGGLAPCQVRRVTDYLEAHLADDVALADLAALTGLSKYHLCRAFKRSTGLPPHRWLMARRIERARELLERTNLPVTDIAAAVGYRDPGQLTTVFRRAVGFTPSHYRRERQA